ncbi:MAG: TIGR02206 family membrane protein [Bacteroidota bacterium]
MTSIFAVDFPGHALQLFGPAHLAALTCIVLFNLFLLRYRGASEEVRRTVRWTLALVLWLNEIAWHTWNLAVGRWTIQEMLPLHICSLMVWLGGLMLVTKNYRIYEFSYFIGIAGALQALLTPNVGIYGFPHFWFFQTFISHGLIVTSAIYMTTVEGFRPTWRSILRVVIVLNLYMVPVYFVNSAIGSDYLFVNSKPATASLLDMLPPWPVYILYMEAIGLVMFGLLYLPFWIRDLRARPKVAIA